MNQLKASTQALKRQKEARKNTMVQHALILFCEQGIEATTFNDVASASSLGVASAFRYFESKHHLVIEASTLMWRQLLDEVKASFPSQFNTYTGLEQIRFILNLFKSFYLTQPAYFRFIEEFDQYVLTHQLSQTMLKDYEHHVLSFQPLMIAMIEKGKHDHSIRQELDSMLLYLTITHQLMSLISKLVSRGHVLSSDDMISGEAQLECVIDMIVSYIQQSQ